jgi:hypothetical protein
LVWNSKSSKECPWNWKYIYLNQKIFHGRILPTGKLCKFGQRLKHFTAHTSCPVTHWYIWFYKTLLLDFPYKLSAIRINIGPKNIKNTLALVAWAIYILTTTHKLGKIQRSAKTEKKYFGI